MACYLSLKEVENSLLFSKFPLKNLRMCNFCCNFVPENNKFIMKRFILGLLVTALTGIYCVPAYGWGQEGHRIIAKIAYDHLKCRTRKKVDKIIESQGYSYTEYAQMIEDEYKDMKREIMNKSDEQLLVESYHMTEAIYQHMQVWDGNTYHYIYTWRQPMERQLYIAGIRLAKWLNENL